MNRVLLTASILLLSGASWAADDPILQRQELMENMKDEALKPLIGMNKGEVPFDAETVRASLAIMRHVADEAPGLFPVGSETGHDTEARSTIWEDWDGFEQKNADFAAAVDAALEAAPSTREELDPALKKVLGTCKGCHDNYRVD
jgi:cytochrome c556